VGACTAVGGKADLTSTTPLRSFLSPLVPCLATSALFPRPPVCAPPLSGAPETVTPSDTSMPVRGREWHHYVGLCSRLITLDYV